MTQERMLYSDDEGVRITSTRAIFGDITYAMANISSIRTRVIPPSRAGAFITIVIGLFMALSGFGTDLTMMGIIGIILILLGILWCWKATGEYHVMISSSSGEASALKSKNKEYIAKVTQALHEALISRG